MSGPSLSTTKKKSTMASILPPVSTGGGAGTGSIPASTGTGGSVAGSTTAAPKKTLKDMGKKVVNANGLANLNPSNMRGMGMGIKKKSPDGFDPEDVEEEDGDSVGDLYGEVNETFGDAAEDFEEGLTESVEEINEEGGVETEEKLPEHVQEHMDKVEIATGVMGSLDGLRGMVDAFKSFKEGKDNFEKIDAVFDMLSSANSTVESGASLTGSFAAEESKEAVDAEAVGKWTGGVGDALGALKSAFSSIKKTVEAVKEASNNTAKQNAKAALNLAEDWTNTAKSTLESINGIKEALGGDAFGGIGEAIPGLDIALTGINIIKEAYTLIVAWKEHKKMLKEKEEIEKGEAGISGDVEEIRILKAERDNVQSVKDEDSGRIKTMNDRIDLLNAEIAAKGADSAYNKSSFLGLGKSEKEKAQAEIAELTKERDRLAARQGLLDGKITIAQKKIDDKEKSLDPGRLDKVNDYSLISEIDDANKKRIVRNSVLLVADFASLAGGIANLTGVGGGVGAGLKAAAGGLKVGMKGARMAKQTGRDKAAKSAAISDGASSSMFDTSKSSAAKKARRQEQMKYLMNKVRNLPTNDEVKFNAEVPKIEGYFNAIGIEPATLYKKNGNPQEQFNMLYKALIEREF